MWERDTDPRCGEFLRLSIDREAWDHPEDARLVPDYGVFPAEAGEYRVEPLGEGGYSEYPLSPGRLSDWRDVDRRYPLAEATDVAANAMCVEMDKANKHRAELVLRAREEEVARGEMDEFVAGGVLEMIILE